MTKRALVVGGGGLRGAYDAGVVATLCRELGPNYFDSVYASSVGVFASTFFIANQPDIIENTWRNLVHGRQLVNFANPFRGRQILDLEYLAEIFQNEKAQLDLQAVIRSNSRLVYALTEHHSRKVTYLQPTEDNLFDAMMASSAIPIVHSPVRVNGTLFVDGGLTDKLPIKKAKEDGNEDIIVVYNKTAGFAYHPRESLFSKFLTYFLPKDLSRLVNGGDGQNEELNKMLESETSIYHIRPKQHLPLSSALDTDWGRINDSIDMGIEDAQDFLEKRYS